jgi:hypothetical protein
MARSHERGTLLAAPRGVQILERHAGGHEAQRHPGEALALELAYDAGSAGKRTAKHADLRPFLQHYEIIAGFVALVAPIGPPLARRAKAG